MKNKQKDYKTEDYEKIINFLSKKEGYFFIGGFAAGLIFGAVPGMWIALIVVLAFYIDIRKKDSIKGFAEKCS
jgi:hypothetical protein